jgi:hypothetical protein
MGNIGGLVVLPSKLSSLVQRSIELRVDQGKISIKLIDLASLHVRQADRMIESVVEVKK